MGTLYECLKEVRLEKYYPLLRANGITRSETLSKLTPQDCSALGITSTDDRRRFIELINIIKSVNMSVTRLARESPARKSTGSSRKRNRSPVSQRIAGQSINITNEVRVREANIRSSVVPPLDILRLLSESHSTDDSASSSEHSDYEPASKHSSSTPNQTKSTPVSRIKHDAGYNYGVPKSSVSTRSGGKSKRMNEDKIKVCVRKRPINKREERLEDEDIVQTESTNAIVVNEPKVAVDLAAYTLQHEFLFDEVFDENCTNEDVYIRAARPLIHCVFTKRNATCFAYGQTGAGKTYTMLGYPNIPGLYLLAAQDIFSIMESGQYGRDLKLWVSYFEIYCGQLFDLLNRRNRLFAREDSSHKVCIAGLTETEVKDSQAIMQVLEYGNTVRSKGATGVNPDSSRSHAVLQLEIRTSRDRQLGKMSFIDLAGSERASDAADTDKQTRIEGAEINQSLLALKECIRSIDQDSRHTPFRQSKLTHILKDSFVGNSRTIMIANISPSQSSCEHTLNTLRYADRVKELRKNLSGAASRASTSEPPLLMNIPAKAPSIFHPTNILSSSTPMKPARYISRRDQPGDSPLEFSETPIRGHGVARRNDMSRKTAAYSGKSSPVKTNVSVSSSRERTSVARHLASSVLSIQRQKPHLEASPSDSDHTDTESCNITEPTRGTGSKYNNIPVNKATDPVLKSSDTENDFPTSDFNNVDDLNDLNRSGGKYANFESKRHKETTSSVNKRDDVPPRHTSTGSYIEQSYDTFKSNSRASKINDLSQGRSIDSSSASFVDAPQHVVKPKHSHSSPEHHATPPKGLPSIPASTESFEDEMLFGDSVQVAHSTHTLNVDGSLENGHQKDFSHASHDISGASNAPKAKEALKNCIKTPRENFQPTTIPAVLPAKSSELTSFSHRSPMRILVDTDDQDCFHPELQVKPAPIPSVADTQQSQLTDNNSELSRDIPDSPRSERSDSIGSSVAPRAVNSDHGQGPYKNLQSMSGSNLRREKSDPLLNLHKHQQKQTLPKPEEFLQRLSKHHRKHSSGNTSDTSSLPSLEKRHDSSVEPSDTLSNHWSSTTSSHKRTESAPGKTTVMDNLYKNVETDNTTVKEVDEDWVPPIYAQNHFSRSQSNGSSSSDNAKVGYEVPTFQSSKSTFNTACDSSTSLSKNAQSNKSSTDESGSVMIAKSAGEPSDLDWGKKNPAQTSISYTPKQKDSQTAKPDQAKSNSILNSHGKMSRTVIEKETLRSNSPSTVLQNKTTMNSVVKTEKLQPGAIFSPIHPHPVTTGSSTETGSSTVISKELVQPTPISQVVNKSEQSLADLRTNLILAHEDQLAAVTSSCKQEMKLLLHAKNGSRSFDDYMKRLNEVLNNKINSIHILQKQIQSYHARKTTENILR